MSLLIATCLMVGGCGPEAFSPEAPPEPAYAPLSQVSEPEIAWEPRRKDWGAAVEQWRPLVAGQFPPEQVEMAMCVIYGESRGEPGARNPSSGAAGLWQFIPDTWDRMVRPHLGGPSYAEGGPYDPELSTLYAAWLWAAEGWGQWSAAGRC